MKFEHRNIYIKILNSKPASIKDLLMNVTIGPYWKPTYQDSDCTILECNAKRRSFEDICCIVNTYFPEASEVDIMQNLRDLRFHFYFCAHIRKIVFHYINTDYSVEKGNFYDLPVVRVYNEKTYTKEELQAIYNQCKKEKG